MSGRETIKPDLLELIRQSMRDGKNGKTNSAAKLGTSDAPVELLRAKGSPRASQTKLQPRADQHGKLGDFSRSATNSPRSSYTSTTAIVGYEEVPKTHFSQKDERAGVLDAETEMILKAVKIALNGTGGAPSKRVVKRAAAPKMTKSDRVFASNKGCGVGSSRSVTLGIVKAIASDETGCIVREQMKDRKTKGPLKPLTLQQSQKNANTTQGNYNPMIVE